MSVQGVHCCWLLFWDTSTDRVESSIARLAADVEQLRADGLDYLWHDSVTAQIERLKHDVGELNARTLETDASDSVQENQP